jgi:hypothetical protein
MVAFNRFFALRRLTRLIRRTSPWSSIQTSKYRVASLRIQAAAFVAAYLDD